MRPGCLRLCSTGTGAGGHIAGAVSTNMSLGWLVGCFKIHDLLIRLVIYGSADFLNGAVLVSASLTFFSFLLVFIGLLSTVNHDWNFSDLNDFIANLRHRFSLLCDSLSLPRICRACSYFFLIFTQDYGKCRSLDSFNFSGVYLGEPWVPHNSRVFHYTSYMLFIYI